jgi:hypothetical protein
VGGMAVNAGECRCHAGQGDGQEESTQDRSSPQIHDMKTTKADRTGKRILWDWFVALLTFPPGSGRLLAMSSPLPADSRMISAHVGRCRVKIDCLSNQEAKT